MRATPSEALPGELAVPKLAIIGGSRLLRISVSMLLESRGWNVSDWPWPEPGEDGLLLVSRPPRAIVDLVGSNRRQRDLIARLADQGCEVVAITPDSSREWSGRCVELGAAAALSAEEPFEALLEVLESVVLGEDFWSVEERAALLAERHAARLEEGAIRDRFDRLTPREAALLGRIVEGDNADRIAREEFLSPDTVRSHIKSILRKLEVSSQLEAVALARRARWPSSSA